MREDNGPVLEGSETEVAREVTAEFHATPPEYAAVRSHAAVADRSARSRGTFAGAKAADVLTGLVTNDVVALLPGHGAYAAALTPKGKIIADLRIFAREGDLLVDVAPRAASGFWTMIRKFVNPRLAKYSDVSASTCEVVVLGPKGPDVMQRAFGSSLAPLLPTTPFSHVELETPHGRITVARIPDYGVEAYSLFAAAEARETLVPALTTAGGRSVSDETLAVVRMEAGRAEWGIEIDESTIPQEANFDELQAISYTKGCYTGQETVARVHFRGHVNKHLRGIRIDSGASVHPRSALHDSEGKNIGEIRSVAHSPRLGSIALAMVRREIALESEVLARTSDGDVIVRVVSLPFPHG